MKEIETSSEFNEYIKAHEIVVCDFFTMWCGPCKMLSPVLEELARETAETLAVGSAFCKVDCDKLPDLADQFNITSIPAVVFFVKGKPAKDVIVGARPKAVFAERLAKLARGDKNHQGRVNGSNPARPAASTAKGPGKK